MKILLPLITVIALAAIAFVGAQANHAVFGIWIPYAAVIVFMVGFVLKVLKWGRSPVPFRIPTTAGQMKSFAPWIKQNKLDNPSSRLGVLGRMLLEVFLFRSLFRNTKTQLYPENKTHIRLGEVPVAGWAGFPLVVPDHLCQAFQVLYAGSAVSDPCY